MKKYFCEAIGTAVLVLFGCGTALITQNYLGVDIVATSLAFGLAIIAMAYAIGNVSGCHVNPAVSLAMFINKKLTIKEFIFYVLAQIIGAFIGIGILYFIYVQMSVLGGTEGAIEAIGMGANGFGEKSALKISMWGALVVEIVLTFVFIYTILGVTSDKNKKAVSGIVIGLTLTFVHILGIYLTGTSVNPARSLAPAVILGGKALEQVWLFIVAPLVGSFLATLTFKKLNK